MADLTPSEMMVKLQRLMERNLGVKGADFASQMKRAPRALPKKLQAEAKVILDAAKMGGHPKLERQMDSRRLQQAYVRLVDHLNGIDPKERFKSMMLKTFGSMAANILLLILAALLFYVVLNAQ